MWPSDNAKEFCFCRNKPGNPELFCHSGSQSEHRIHFILPSGGDVIIRNCMGICKVLLLLNEYGDPCFYFKISVFIR